MKIVLNSIAIGIISVSTTVSFAGTGTLDNRTDGTVQATLNIMWAPDKIISADAHTKKSEDWFGPRCINGISFVGLDGIIAGIRLNYPAGPCGSITMIIGQDVIDKNQTQKELEQLQSRLTEIESQTFPSGKDLTLAQLAAQKKATEEYESLKKDIATRKALFAEFSEKINNLNSLLQTLRQKNDTTQAQLLSTRIDSTLKTGKLVKGIAYFGGLNTAARISKWPGLDGTSNYSFDTRFRE